jgi:hypothetical protein
LLHKGEFPVNDLNYVSMQYSEEFSDAAVGTKKSYAVLRLAEDQQSVRHVARISSSDDDGDDASQMESNGEHDNGSRKDSDAGEEQFA